MKTDKTKEPLTFRIKLEATLHQQDAPPETPSTKSTCANCSSCGNCKQVRECGPLLQHAGRILMNLLNGVYRQDQVNDAFEWVDGLLRRHYSGDLEEQGKG